MMNEERKDTVSLATSEKAELLDAAAESLGAQSETMSEEKLLEMQNPSEPKKHYEFVPPEVQTVNQALAWRIGWKLDAFKEPVAKS